MIQEQFDINRIIGVKIVGKREANYRWLPEKQKTTFFGLIKLKSWYNAGFYSEGCYTVSYGESGEWEADSYTAEELRKKGYIVQEDKVFCKPYVTIYLESDYQTTKNFQNEEEAHLWVDKLKTASGRYFEIVNK